MKKILVFFLVFTLIFSTTGCQLLQVAKPKPKPTKNTVKIDALYFTVGPEGPSGGISKVTLTVEKNPAKEIRVGFYESEVAGSGPMWRSAGWMAAITGPFILGRDISEFRFTFDVSGKIDGPSAGGLMTAAVLAGLLGDTIKKDVTMTGTINPDGTIGPVGGIPQKLEGAKKANKKLVLIPSGQRYSEDAKTEELVDVVEKGEKEGIKVREVSDVYAAYKQLTGKDLPRPKELDKKAELPSDVYDKVKGKAKKWYSRYLEEKGKYDAISPMFKSTATDNLIAKADSSGSKAAGYLKQGLVASAYNQVTAAVLYTTIAYQISKTIEAYFGGGISGAEVYLESIKPASIKIDGLLDDLKAQKPKTLADTVAIADAYGVLSLATGLEDFAGSFLKAGVSTDEERLTNLVIAASFYALASRVVDGAEDSLSVGMGAGPAKTPSGEKIARIADALRKASEANINYFDTVVLAGAAEARGMSLDRAKQWFMSNDINYAFAVSSINSLDWLKERLGKGAASNFAVLGNSLYSYQLSANLIASYYSLNAQRDEEGNITGVENEKAMINMLDMAQELSQENINLAIKAGASPVLSILYFEGGKVLREGNTDEKFEALGNFWLASMEARILAILGEAKIKGADRGLLAM